MANWQIEQVAVGIAVLALFIHLAAWCKLCDRVTRLEALVKLLEIKLLENEIIVMHKKKKKEVSPELAKKLDKKYNFDGGVYYENDLWWKKG